MVVYSLRVTRTDRDGADSTILTPALVLMDDPEAGLRSFSLLRDTQFSYTEDPNRPRKILDYTLLQFPTREHLLRAQIDGGEGGGRVVLYFRCTSEGYDGRGFTVRFHVRELTKTGFRYVTTPILEVTERRLLLESQSRDP